MLRIGTFNIENLFDRPAIINMEDSKKSSQLLKLADRLQAELNRKTYDKVKIRELLDELKGYVTIRVDTGRFFKTKTGGAVAAEGPQDWAGAIEFTREKFDSGQRKNTADAIKALKADILCLVEVEGRQALSDFNREFFSGQSRYPFNMLIDSPNDPRGIDIALQWKDGNPGVLRSNAYDRAMIQKKLKKVFSRDCLEVELIRPDGSSIYSLCNHFKSKMGGDSPESQAKREAQAKRVVEIANSRYNLKKDYVVVLGDLNDVPGSKPLKPLMNDDNLHDVFDVVNHPADDRWTYYYKRARVAERKTQIDYVMVSSALKRKVTGVEIFRRGMSCVAMGDVTGITPLPGMDSFKNAASDHAAILVDLDI